MHYMDMQGGMVCVLRGIGYRRHMQIHRWRRGGRLKEQLERRDAKSRKSTLQVDEYMMFVLHSHLEGNNWGRVYGCEGSTKAKEGASE